MEPDRCWREGEVGAVDANLEPEAEHQEDRHQTEQGEGVADDSSGSGLGLPELVNYFRLDLEHAGLFRLLLLGELYVDLCSQPGCGVGDDGVADDDSQRIFS